MNKKNKYITVTKPFLPELKEFIPYLESIWDKKWVTNNGEYHQRLEYELENFLGVKHVSLCVNGTLALMLALKALDIRGEVITTPFSFVATSHAIAWNNASPVFCDIDEKTFNIDPDKIEKLITDKTTAIMPVHVYGNPCDNEKIQAIASKYDLALIYDAAHAFRVEKDKQSILSWGDISVLSFHATKVFNTFEGGAVVCHTREMKQKVDDLKNFGIHGETEVTATGINAKMNEIQAAMGLLQLKYVDSNIIKRKNIVDLYTESLRSVPGLSLFNYPSGINANYSYFPLLIDENVYGKSRDFLYEALKEQNIFARRYFYPLISQFPMYSHLASARADNLPIAERIASQILCLPIYPELLPDDIALICSIIKDGFRK